MAEFQNRVDQATGSVRSLRAELRATVQELQNLEVGTPEFDAVNQRAAALKDRMAEVNEQIAVFATGSKYEQVSNSLGEIGAGLRDLDFDRAVNGAKLFQQTASKITFKDAIGSVKQLGGTFLSIAKTILTNPLFLVAGVVAGIVAGIIALLDKLGILKKAFEIVGKAIDAVVQAMKDFLDWIGLTDFAAEDSARKQAEAQEKIAKAHAEKQEKVTDAYDQEIRLAQIAGKNTVDLERQKQYAIIETSRAQYQALAAQMEALRASGDLTKEKADEIRKAMLDLKKNIREARQEVQAINAQEVADQKKKDEEKQKASADAAKKAKEQQKQYAADRLAAQRAIQDAELSLMQEGIDKELLENQIKYDRLIEDTRKNEKLLSDEKKRLMEVYAEEQFKAEQAIQQKYADEAAAAVMEANKNREQKRQEQAQKEKDTYAAAAAAMKEEQDKINQDRLEQEEAYLKARENLQGKMIEGLQGLETFLQSAGVRTAGLQKTLALVQIATDTAKSISAVIQGATAAASATGPAAPFVLAGYIASGIGIVLGAIGQAYAVLKQAPAIGGSTGGGVPSAASTPATAQAPQPQFFGSNNNMNTFSASKPNEVIQVQAVVSETEMSATQAKVAKIQMAASL